jgi:lysophospholipid acyltransferase (LPLAT)-like uncharacterized protein
MAKRLSDLSLRKKIEFYLATRFGWILIVLVCKTCRYQVEGIGILHDLKKKKQPFLFACWHGRIFYSAYFFRFWRIVALVSQHLDGEMIAQTLVRLGFDTVRGSSTHGGKEAFYKMIDRLKNGSIGVVIPDGPNGPRHQIKNGIIYMAYLAGVPIVPFTFSAKPAIVLNSWDRFMVPKPFSKVAVNVSEPIWIPKEISTRELVKIKQHVESVMIKQEQSVDAVLSQ